MKEKDYEQQLLEWRFHQIQFRKKYRNTPAGFQSEQEELEAKKEWREDVKKFRKERIRKLQSLYQPENQPFAGRAQELIQIEHKLKEEQRTAIVYGIGGIGKTALVKEYLCIHQNDYDGILYVTFSKSVKNSVCNDMMLNISDLKFNPEKYGNLTRYYKVKMQALQELMEKGKYLLVLDDCNTEFDQNLDDLIDLSGDKIITTRINPAVWGYSGIEVCSFQNSKEWNEFLNLYTKKSLAEDEKKKIWEYIREVHGHTLAVMLKIYNRDNEFNTKIVGKDLLQRFPLKKREKEILMYLSIMPTEGIPCSLFEIIAQLKDGELQRLQQFLLIQVVRTSFDGEKYISLHPLIAEIVKKEIPADVIKCRSMLKGFEKYLNGENPEKKDLWETSYENNRKLEGCIFAVINAFPEPVPWMATTFDSLATFLWVQGYFEEAEEYSLRIYKAVEDYYGENHQLTGRMAVRTGAVYYNWMKRDQADEWYLKGLEILKKCRPANQEYLVYLMESFAIAARTERHNGAYQRALENIDEALVCFYKFKRQMEEKKQKITYLHCLKLPYYLISKAGILLEMDCLAEAEQMYISAMKFFDAVSVDEFRKNTFRNLYVEILMRKNAYEEAKEIVMLNLKYAFLYRGESYKDTLMCMEKLADIYVCLHRENEAVEMYQKVLIHLRRDYPYQENWIEQVCSKMNC